jgi:hypothetical protein
MLPITGVYAEMLPHLSIGGMLWLTPLCVRVDRHPWAPGSRPARCWRAVRQSPRAATGSAWVVPEGPCDRWRREHFRQSRIDEPGQTLTSVRLRHGDGAPGLSGRERQGHHGPRHGWTMCVTPSASRTIRGIRKRRMSPGSHRTCSSTTGAIPRRWEPPTSRCC